MADSQLSKDGANGTNMWGKSFQSYANSFPKNSSHRPDDDRVWLTVAFNMNKIVAKQWNVLVAAILANLKSWNIISCKKGSDFLGCIYIFFHSGTGKVEKWTSTLFSGCSSTSFPPSLAFVSLYLFNLSSLSHRVCFIRRVLLEGFTPYPHISLNKICSYSRMHTVVALKCKCFNSIAVMFLIIHVGIQKFWTSDNLKYVEVWWSMLCVIKSLSHSRFISWGAWGWSQKESVL